MVTIVLLMTASCKPDPIQKYGDVTCRISYVCDAQAIAFDTIRFQNDAGNRYSVTHLEYYISNVQFAGNAVDPFASNETFLVNAQQGTDILFKDLPVGTYNSMTLTIGLDNAHNVTDALPNTLENSAMAWPDPMGGGYHFMKFEGNYLDSLGQQQGFAMHLGKNGNQAVCTFPIQLQVTEEGATLDLHMNLNEWFRNPHTYDFNVDGASIMINDAALHKIAENGVDVFL